MNFDPFLRGKVATMKDILGISRLEPLYFSSDRAAFTHFFGPKRRRTNSKKVQKSAQK